jgi:Na+-transporting NADH:ubiquinone oxidoreductase subunit C
LQEADEALYIEREILKIAGLYQPDASDAKIHALFNNVETRIVELESGAYAEHIDPQNYDYEEAARLGEFSMEVPADLDIARINVKAKYAPVYLVRDKGELKKVILPVHGYGLWSTMYGFIAIQSDGNTVDGLTFYDHGETPGLGGEISNPDWLANWSNKLVYDDDGKVQLHVVKGSVGASDKDKQYKVDGISGATLTANGVTNLVRFWLGDQGFGPYLEKLRKREA